MQKMSENALKRIKLVMAYTESHTVDPDMELSAHTLWKRLRQRFLKHHYNLMTVKLFLYRLYEARQIQIVGHEHLPLYRLTEVGLIDAERRWTERYELGYIDPAAALLAITTREFISAPV
jgi:hypothetical protein